MSLYKTFSRYSSMEMIDVYLVPYHSFAPTKRLLAAASERFACVEKAVAANEWPYDNGDDPSFFAARREGGLITWGGCRKDVRSTIRCGSICVFFAFTNCESEVKYRMSAIATVAERLDRRSAFQDSRFRGKTYINLLIRPEGDRWVYDESDRHKDQRHADWLWRISEHEAIGKDEFRQRHNEVYNAERFVNSDVNIAKDYIIFSQNSNETYISRCPPLVAVAKGGKHEDWVNKKLQQLTIGVAADLHPSGRSFLRSEGSGYVHRQFAFQLSPDKAAHWRQALISALQESECRVD